jgi:hypothetical protein
MHQTSLNLVAIGIFGMTLSALLGPVFNISPAVPAIAVFAFLALATIDSFSWQGRGVSILVDWFARFSPEYRQRVIHHEAGHFLVAYLLGIPIASYTLSAWEAWKQGQPGAAGVAFDDPELTAPLPLGSIQRYYAIWMAGIAAETLVYGNAEGGAEDRQKLQGVMALLKRPTGEFQLQERQSLLQAKTLIQENWAAYEALVAAMTQRTTVAECCQAIAACQQVVINR